jgi:hypothetical protein
MERTSLYKFLYSQKKLKVLKGACFYAKQIMVILQLEFVVQEVGNKDMNSLSDVKISPKVSLIFVSTFGLVDSHVKFIIFTTFQV